MSMSFLSLMKMDKRTLTWTSKMRTARWTKGTVEKWNAQKVVICNSTTTVFSKDDCLSVPDAISTTTVFTTVFKKCEMRDGQRHSLSILSNKKTNRHSIARSEGPAYSNPLFPLSLSQPVFRCNLSQLSVEILCFGSLTKSKITFTCTIPLRSLFIGFD